MTTQSFNPLYPMLIHKYEEFIPDQNASVIDKINAIIQTLNQVGTLTNDVVKDWNTVYQWCMNDGLQTDVNNKIDEELAKGTFDAILTSLFTPVVGDLTTLTTADKGNLVAAINDLQAEADSNKNLIGDLTTLTTADKDTLVHAINNNVASLAQIAIQVKPSGGDDTTTIQNAINSLTNGGRILFTPGTYLVSKSVTNYVLTVKSNIEFIGLKGKVTIKLNNGSGTVYLLGNANYVENIKIRNIIFDGNYPTLTGSIMAFYLPNVKNFVSEFNTYQNFGGQGVNYGDITLAQDITHYKDYFDTILGTGILTHNNRKIVVRDCHFNNVKDSNVNVTAETVEDVETFVLVSGNVAICPSDFTAAHSVFSLMGDNTQVLNNKIVNGAVQIVVHVGAFSKNSRNYLINGNVLENGGQGITVNQDVNTKIIVTNNFIKNPSSSGVEVTGWDGSSTLQGEVIVANNIIEGSGSTAYTQFQVPMAIKLDGVVNAIIKSNIINNPNYAGIGLIKNNKNVLIYGNTIDGHIGTAPTDSVNHYGGGIYVEKYAMTVTQKNILIDNNLITNFMTGVPSPVGGGLYGAAIVVVGDSVNPSYMKQIAIRNNHIDTGSGMGISIAYTTDAKVYNNSVWATGQTNFNNVTNTTPYVTNAVI